MKAIRASIVAERKLQFEEFDVPDQPVGDHILIKTDRTVVSAGTELANYTGLDPDTRVTGAWCAYPWAPGYGGVGRVVALGPDVKSVRVGQRLYGFYNHASYQYTNESALLVDVPDALDSTTAAMARLFSVGITGYQRAHPGLRDLVVIIGLGLVGNMCGQYYVQSGQRVVGIDPASSRRRSAQEVGFVHTIDPTGLSVGQLSNRLSDFSATRPSVVVDAVGEVKHIEVAVGLVANNGEVLMLGSPRAPYTDNCTPFIGDAHKRGVAIIGALEWTAPVFKRQSQGRSIEGNTELIFGMLLDGGLKSAPLCSHVLPPSKLNEAYRGLLDQKDAYIGVVLDWENYPAPTAG